MEENFDPVARTRANYYTPGSPVQFVCVELLKGEASGDHAVCLTFKNISRVTLTALEIHFKCKGVDGVILCEDQFEYRDIEVKPGEAYFEVAHNENIPFIVSAKQMTVEALGTKFNVENALFNPYSLSCKESGHQSDGNAGSPGHIFKESEPVHSLWGFDFSEEFSAYFVFNSFRHFRAGVLPFLKGIFIECTRDVLTFQAGTEGGIFFGCGMA